MTLRSCGLADAAAGSATQAHATARSAASARRGQLWDMRASVAEARSGGYRLERVRAVGGVHRVLEQRVLGRAQLGVRVEQRARAHAGALEQLGVLGQPRDLELGEAGLARAQHLALAAQPEVDLGELEAVAVIGERAQPRRLLRPEEDAHGRVLAAADAPAQLVQLRDAVALGVLD